MKIHRRTFDHHPDDTAYQRFNKEVALRITGAVGSMTCAYIFAALALVSLPAAIASGSVIIIVSWIAQTFLQLVLLSVIMVGQNVASAAADARSIKTFDDVVVILDRLDTDTQGGIETILRAIEKIK